MTKFKLKSIEKAILVSLILSFIFPMFKFINNCESISNKVIRLHILANSDSEVDQSLKLLVRDKILKSSCLFLDKNDDTIEKAEQKFLDNIEMIKHIAQQEVYNRGFDYEINAEMIDNMYFDTRKYDNFTMPSGEYKALRITIGEGKGKNWWCVMFPPLCISAAEDHTEIDDILTTSEKDVLNDRYEVKFKIVEYFELIKNILYSFMTLLSKS